MSFKLGSIDRYPERLGIRTQLALFLAAANIACAGPEPKPAQASVSKPRPSASAPVAPAKAPEAPVPAHVARLRNEKGSLEQMSMPDRFVYLVDHFPGNLQKGEFRETPIYVKTLMESKKADPYFLQTLIEGLDRAHIGEGLLRPGIAMIILHDGNELPVNLVDGNENAVTHAVAGVSVTFTSVPIREKAEGVHLGKLLHVSVFATELCQAFMIAEQDHLHAETVCNSYGLAAAFAYEQDSYEKYAQAIGQVGAVEEPRIGTLTPTVFPREVYEYLKTNLAGKEMIIDKPIPQSETTPLPDPTTPQRSGRR